VDQPYTASAAVYDLLNEAAGKDYEREADELQHLVGSVHGIEHIVESHDLTLFADDEYRGAFERAGLSVETVTGPHPDRDRYVALAG
jgi:hypothetical protein